MIEHRKLHHPVVRVTTQRKNVNAISLSDLSESMRVYARKEAKRYARTTLVQRTIDE